MNTIELKHTPSPWYAVDYGGCQILHTAPCYGNKDLLDSEDVGLGFAISNGMLCAAAPLLLSALIKAVEDHERVAAWFNAHKGNIIRYPVPDWYHEAKDALAAAGVTITEDAKTDKP